MSRRLAPVDIIAISDSMRWTLRVGAELRILVSAMLLQMVLPT